MQGYLACVGLVKSCQMPDLTIGTIKLDFDLIQTASRGKHMPALHSEEPGCSAPTRWLGGGGGHQPQISFRVDHRWHCTVVGRIISA